MSETGSPDKIAVFDMSRDAKKVGPAIRRVRTEKQQSLGELAGKLGIGISTLSGIEQGDKPPQPELLSRCEVELGLPKGWFGWAGGHVIDHRRARTFRREILELIEQGFCADESAVESATAPDWQRDTPTFAQLRASVRQLATRPSILRRSKIIATAEQLLAVVASQPGIRLDDDGKLRQGQIILTYRTAEIGDRKELLKKALRNQWQVVAGYKMHERSPNEQLEMIQNMIDVAGVGGSSYESHAIGLGADISEYLLVPEVFALAFHEAREEDDETASFFFVESNLEIVQARTDRIRKMLRSCPHILQVFRSGHQRAEASKGSGSSDAQAVAAVPPPIARIRFNMAVTPNLTGHTFLCKNGLSLMSMLPLDVDDERITRVRPKKGDDWYQAAKILVQQRAEQLEKFRELLPSHESIHLISKDGIDEMLSISNSDGQATGKGSDHGEIVDDWIGEPLTDDEMLKYLNNAITMMERYSTTLKIGFIKERPAIYCIGSVEAPMTELGDGFSGGATYFEAFRSNATGGREEIDIEIRSRIFAMTFLRAIQEDYEDKEITPSKTEEVIAFLKDRRELLEGRVRKALERREQRIVQDIASDARRASGA
jgi:transcriptional regulator with XRE-family HTH domain